MIDTTELTEIIKSLEVETNSRVNLKYNQFCDELTNLALKHDLPAQLINRINLFKDQIKPLFFVNYKHQLKSTLVARISQPQSIGFKTSYNFNDAKNRLWLETYLSCGQNGRLASHTLGVPKSTFADWLKRNRDLVYMEINKTKHA